ncbi:hypothetical protein [Micromonospora sp. NPDC048839]|uniref:hypothetical protein n=1 Tax=Micromonospora sp. NPDC048839 TaxID=3155641 RepID=UPI0033CF9710
MRQLSEWLKRHEVSCRREVEQWMVTLQLFREVWALPEAHDGTASRPVPLRPGALQGVAARAGADLPGATTTTEPSGADRPQPPLHLLTHHLQRVVAVGRSALVPDVERDARALLDAQLPTAASVLRELRRAGHRRSRDAFGRLSQQDSIALALAWLVAGAYQDAVATAATAGSWQAD